jgi:hypothetical protein
VVVVVDVGRLRWRSVGTVLNEVTSSRLAFERLFGFDASANVAFPSAANSRYPLAAIDVILVFADPRVVSGDAPCRFRRVDRHGDRQPVPVSASAEARGNRTRAMRGRVVAAAMVVLAVMAASPRR